MSRRNKTLLLSIIALCSLTAQSHAQCKKYAKKECPDLLGEQYIPSGRAHSITLYPGESVVATEIFYPGQRYQIVTCAQADVAPSHFTVTDRQGNLLFSTMDSQEFKWEFEVENTIELDIKLYIPRLTSHTTPLPGCAGVLIGMTME